MLYSRLLSNRNVLLQLLTVIASVYFGFCTVPHALSCHLNPLDSKGNYSATLNNTKLVHWPLMDGLLHLLQTTNWQAGAQPSPSSLYQM